MSLSDPPSFSFLMLRPRYAKPCTSSILSPCNSILSAFLVLTLITFVLDLLILRPTWIEIFASLISLDCMLLWLYERRAMSSAKSRSSSRTCPQYAILMFFCRPPHYAVDDKQEQEGRQQATLAHSSEYLKQF